MENVIPPKVTPIPVAPKVIAPNVTPIAVAPGNPNTGIPTTVAPDRPRGTPKLFAKRTATPVAPLVIPFANVCSATVPVTPTSTSPVVPTLM